MDTQDTWPAGATWVFQGTVVEDATAGTHVCTLTVTPGAGNEMEVLYGSIIDGNTATSQTVSFVVDDGTNVINEFLGGAQTTALAAHHFLIAHTGNSTLNLPAGYWFGTTTALIVSGTMRLILKVTTTAISVTQTFALVCRIKGAIPTATLNDTVGTSTNTTNTNRVF